MKKILILLISVIVLCLFAGCSKAEKEKLVISYDDSVNGYTISLYQVGEPQGTFGDVTAKLILQDSAGNVIDEENFELANDGANVVITNISEVNWFDDRVEILVKELDTTNQYTYTLSYN